MSKILVSSQNQKLEHFISSIEHFFTDKDPKDDTKSSNSNDDKLILKFRIRNNENQQVSEKDKYSLII